MITPQSSPIDVLIASLHELHIRNTFDMADTRSNMQISDINSKPHNWQSPRDLIYWVISVWFYPPTG